MAAAVLVLGALSLETVGTTDLENAALPTPDDPAWVLVQMASTAANDGVADPRPDALSKTALPGHAYDLIYLDRIHVVPRYRDLGAVVSEQEIEIEVWNAHRRRSQTLEDITIDGPAGIEVDDHLGLPAQYPATDSQVYTVRVLAEGDPQIDNVVAWVFADIDEAGTDLSVLGFRLIPFPFAPNMSDSIRESFGYRTAIITSFTGMEQRRQLRNIPVGSVGYAVYLGDRRDAQMAAAILFGNQARTFGVGRWQFQTPLASTAALGATEVYCTTEHIPFESGGLVMLWTDPYHWEVQTIDTVEADHLVLSAGLRNQWEARVTAVLPVVIGRLSNDETLSWEALAKASQRLTFSVDGFKV